MQAGIADAILSMRSDAVIATDLAGSITVWNPGAERIFGYTAPEALGQSLDLIIPDALRARHWQGYHHVMATGSSRYGDGDLLAVPALVKSGARISVEFTMAVLHDEAGRPSGAVSILRDVSKRFEETRLLKQQLAAARQQFQPHPATAEG
ncbi:PAS domain S-box protein [Tardiphaga alba]|uniref:PAS domain S-box protein n=2 Tax=Tardiphaga alba TaxID=340268 RepID=A0ABX8AFL2_9BRAD|nr:PAS domain-containing protein [Tardiphaga alba]QUS42522.1 PAS domain S-box protein [Tardiphaga alba]